MRHEGAVAEGPEQLVEAAQSFGVVDQHDDGLLREIGLFGDAAGEAQARIGARVFAHVEINARWHRVSTRRGVSATPQQELEQHGARAARAALAGATLVGGAGDVEVRPGQVLRELGEERRGGDGAAVAAGRRWPCPRNCS